MKFLVHYEGKGEGCDYTIGCNHALRSMEADSPARAIKRVACELLDYDGDTPYDPKELSGITIYTLAEPDIADSTSLDLEKICAVRQVKAESDAANEREAQDRAQYESLKARFEKGEAANENQST